MKLSNLQLEVQKYTEEKSPKMVVGLPCGSGKTIATLVASKDAKLVIVVMPKMLKQEKTWENNQEKIGTDTKLLTISKEQFRKYHKKLPPCDCLILDEFGSWAVGVSPVTKKVKGQDTIVTSQLHDAVMWYVNTHKPESLYLLDATASAGKAMSLWATKRILGQLNITVPLATSFQRFREEFYFAKVKGYTTLWLPRTTEKVKKRLSELWQTTGVFFYDSEMIEPIETVINIVSTPPQLEILQEISELYSEPLVLRCRNFMALNGAYTKKEFDDNTHSTIIKKVQIPTNKEVWIGDFINKNNKQVVIFATFTSQINKINDYLNKIGVSCETITGATKDKSIIAEQFRAGTLQAIVVQSSICSGWEAPDCDTIIRASQPIRADHAIQQQGRIDRKTNRKQNYTYNLIIPNTVDEEAYDIIKRGEDIHFATLEDYEE